MARLREPAVAALLDGLSPLGRKIVLALRKQITRAVPAAEESILWGGISYHRPWIGGRVKGALCQIGFKNKEVLEFIHGVRLVDPERLLQGNALSKRFIRVAAAERPEVAALIRAAAALDPGEWA